jgi:hypothetical protein
MSTLFSIRKDLVEIGKTCKGKCFNLPGFARLSLNFFVAQSLALTMAGVGLADAHVNPQDARDKQEFERSRQLISAQRQAALDQVAARTAVEVNRLNADIARRTAELHARNQQTLQNMRRAYAYEKFPDHIVRPVRTYSQREIDDTAQQMSQQEEASVNGNYLRSQLSAQFLRQKDEVDLEADNLQSQLDVDRSRHGFKLSPVGTNLYVRNYQLGGGSAGDDENMPATGLRAPAARTLSNGQTPTAARAVPGRLSVTKPPAGISSVDAGKSGTMVKTTVTGKFLKQ